MRDLKITIRDDRFRPMTHLEHLKYIQEILSEALFFREQESEIAFLEVKFGSDNYISIKCLRDDLSTVGIAVSAMNDSGWLFHVK